MKRLLLDTQVLLWWISDDASLSVKAKEVIANPDNAVFVSAATAWEISVKKASGKLTAPDNIESIIEDEGFEALPISLFHAESAGCLPKHHADPFDRMLIAQAQAEGLVLVTKDKQIPQYGVRVLW